MSLGKYIHAIQQFSVVLLLLCTSFSAFALPTLGLGSFDPGTVDAAVPFNTLGNCASPLHPYGDSIESLGYGGTEGVTPALMGIAGDDAPIDWVLVEIRSANVSDELIAARAGLLQSDGDVVGAQTSEASQAFTQVVEGDYYIVLRHRNHLGIMTADIHHLIPGLHEVDFTNRHWL